MDSQVNDSNKICKNINCHRCASSVCINYVKDIHNNTSSNDYIFDMNDQTTLISNCVIKKKQINYQCLLSRIMFIHILCIVRKYLYILLL